MFLNACCVNALSRGLIGSTRCRSHLRLTSSQSPALDREPAGEIRLRFDQA
jgi:hypothetical protein